MFTQKKILVKYRIKVFPFCCEKFTSSVAVYRQAQLPDTHREKIITEVYGGETKLLERPWIRSIVKRLRSPCSAADAVSGVLWEEAQRDIKIFLTLFIYRALHLRRVWVDITACKLTTACLWHWSQKMYTFWATLQHLLSEKTSNHPLYAAYIG